MASIEPARSLVLTASSGIAFSASVLVLGLSSTTRAQQALRRLRPALLVITAGIAAAVFALGAPTLPLTLSSLAFVFALEAWALAVATPATLDQLAERFSRDPSAWAEFERKFWNSLGRREQNPLRSAVTRSRPDD
jgi:hypothetical protein